MNRKYRHNPTIFRYRSVYLQRIADYVRKGYIYSTSGTIAAKKVGDLGQKFHSFYHCFASKNQRMLTKKAGRANCTLLFYIPKISEIDAETVVQWTLLFTAGDSVAHKLEKLTDATNPKTKITHHNLELVQLPRPGQATPAWTWRFDAKHYEHLRDTVIAMSKVTRGQTSALEDFLETLAKTPGFAGVRHQVKQLFKLARASVKRYSADTVELNIPKHRYLQRLENGTFDLLALEKAIAQNARVGRDLP